MEAKPPAIEDPLSYLPRALTRKYGNGEVIYDFPFVNTELHLVIEGYVNVTRRTGTTEVIMDVCQADEFFGEAALVQSADGERASAIGLTKVMSWPVGTVKDLMLREPGLGLGLAQMLACRCISLEGRIVALSADSTARRLAKALLYLAERFGHAEQEAQGVIRIAPFSHKLLAQYIGSTRAAVTRSLIQMRRENLVQYSRKYTLVNYEALRNLLSEYQPAPTVCLSSAEADRRPPEAALNGE